MLWSLARSKVAVVSQNVAVAGPSRGRGSKVAGEENYFREVRVRGN